MPELDQILAAINLGVVTLDRDLRVESWNRWMEIHSGVAAARITGAHLFEFFPTVESPVFLRSCRSVLRLGNYAFFSQKLHRCLFPFKPPRSLGGRFERMQQSCVMGPIRSEDGGITSLFLVVQDVTELVAHEQALLELNVRDGLTGLYNRRYLDHRLALEVERFRRYGRPFSLLLLDIDHFKLVNDRFGHPCGDAVLKSTAADLAGAVRKADLVARYGGEEFCCLLPETGRGGALTLAEKMRGTAAARQHAWEGQEIPVTVSVGVAEAVENDTVGALLQRADVALYEAKRTGRNRVVAAA